MKRFLGLVLILIICTGCVEYVQPPFEVEVSQNNANRTLTDVDAQGIRTYVWSECITINECTVSFERMKLHQTLHSFNWQAEAGSTFILGDLKTLNNGRTFVTVREVSTVVRGIPSGVDYVVTIPLTPTETPLPVRVTPDGQFATGDLPSLADNGTSAYVVYSLLGTNKTSLHARQLTPTLGDQIDIATSADAYVYDVVSDVDTADRLHLSYMYQSSNSDYLALFYARYEEGQLLYLNPFIQGTSQDFTYTPQDIEVDRDNGIAYIAYSGFDTESSLFVYREALDTTDTTITVLSGSTGLGWSLNSKVSLQVLGNSIYVAFAARTTETGPDAEVWLYLDNQNSASSFEVLTDDDLNQRLVVSAMDGSFLTLAWRDDPAGIISPRTVQGFSCSAQVHTWDSFTTKVRDYYTPNLEDCGSRLDLAANGHYFSMVWDQSARQPVGETLPRVPWASFNSEAVTLPVMRR